jgi:2-iminobutanoate/2-iminopropanoate deaminase
MKKQVISAAAPSAPQFLSQALIVENTIYVSGQIHIDNQNKLVGETSAEKFDQIMNNIHAILKEANSSLYDIVKVVMYVTDLSYIPEINKVYSSYFEKPYPVREAICVKALPLGADIEVSVVAGVR